ncbi:MAG TPA: formylglycine-generating enzyme family protein [Sedimentisphaerales bacterium]|nr:formylglycine-generating enzyme family protein [Sedimentisphaerales bacterium]
MKAKLVVCFILAVSISYACLADSAIQDANMVCIPAGSFQMGDNFNQGDSDERPVHTVELDSYYIGKNPVTNQQYCDYLNASLGKTIYISSGQVFGSQNNLLYFVTHACDVSSQIIYSDNKFTPTEKMKRDMANYPVIEVTWYGAAAYCNWKSLQQNLQQCYDPVTYDCDLSKNGYHLPTEAQWEYAARGGLTDKRFPWGNEISHEQANYYSMNSYKYDISRTKEYHPDWFDWVFPYISPVGSFPPNGFGIYDTSGNAWQWCNDRYSNNYYSNSPLNNPSGPETGNYRVVRGGGWSNQAIDCRVASRFESYPDNKFPDYGFRIAADAPVEPEKNKK